MSSRSNWIFPITCVALAVGGHAAHAEELRKPRDAKALDHLASGNRLLVAGPASAQQAAEEYKAGLMIEYAPIFDYNLGQCFRLLGDYRTAIWHYERFIRQSPDTPEFIERAKQRIEEMRAELEQKARTTPTTEPEPAAASDEAPAPENVRLDTRVATESGDRWYTDAFGWGLTGAGVLGVGAAGVLFLDAANLRDDANRAGAQEERNALHDRADTRQLTGTIIVVAGAGILATGIVKLVIHKDDPRPHHAAWGFAASSGGAFVWGRF